jgi:3'-5' exoribonuclease
VSMRARLDPRSFCGSLPWPLIGQLTDGLDVAACYIVHEKRRAETKASKPFLKLVLGDRTGRIDGMVWDDADRWDPVCEPDQIVGVRGRVGVYQDRLQLRVDVVEPIDVGPAELELLLPASTRDREQMLRELEALVASVQDVPLRTLLRRCVGRGSELGQAFRIHPAAKRNHHAYVCGLLEHSLSVASACARLAEHYREQGFTVDRDLLVAGALLHDIGKLRELRGLPTPGYTTEGRLLGHIVIGIQLVAREAAQVPELAEDRLLLLQHLIASHQGKPEWDSPRVPQILEAVLLHYADDLDAKLNQVRALLDGVAHGEWSGFDRSLERSFFVPPELAPVKNVEPVEATEAVDLVMDLFRG